MNLYAKRPSLNPFSFYQMHRQVFYNILVRHYMEIHEVYADTLRLWTTLGQNGNGSIQKVSFVWLSEEAVALVTGYAEQLGLSKEPILRIFERMHEHASI